MLLQFEKELAQAVEALTKEQEKAAQAEREKQTQVVKPFENALMLTLCQLPTDCQLTVDQDVGWVLIKMAIEVLIECRSRVSIDTCLWMPLVMYMMWWNTNIKGEC